MPFVSIIVPAYNAEKYITRCLDSLFAQTYTDFEIIVIDDGSTDDSLRIMDAYAQKNSRCHIVHQENRGIAAARGAGLALAAGQYIGFVDSDDYVYPDFLEELTRVAVQQDADVVMCNYDRVFEERTEHHCLHLIERTYEDRRRIFIDCMALSPVLWNKLYRRSCIESVGAAFRPLHTGEDYDFNVQLVPGIRRMAVLSKGLYAYVQHPDSVMHASKRIEAKDTFINSFIELQRSGRYADISPDCEDLLAAVAFVGLMFSTASIGQGADFFRKEYRKFRKWEHFDVFCRKVVCGECLSPLVESGAITRRFARIMQMLFIPCLFKMDAMSAYLTVPVSRFIVWKKRKSRSNYR